MKRLDGVFIPAVTPFDEEERISPDMLKDNLDQWNLTDVSGYMCLGSNGEFRMLDDAESLEVIRLFARWKAPEKCLIAGVGRESLYQTKVFIDRVLEEELDIDYLSVLTPHYFKKLMTDEALISYYTEIADFSSLPVLIYCAPGFANGLTISAEAVKELADHPNILGIKDTSPDMMETYLDAAGGRDDFSVMSGSVGSMYRCLKNGGAGAILSAANYFPQECAALYQSWKVLPEEEFLEKYGELRALAEQTGAKNGVAGVKTCMNLLGFQGGRPRRPIFPTKKSMEDDIRQALVSSGKL